ncbi:MAG: hypothetical protein U0R71_00225 [Solirubrobacterales bacterium]
MRLGRLALAATALLWAWLAAANAASASADGCTQYTNPNREGSGVGTWVACGTQAVVGAGFEAYPRSWIFVEQWANGPRVIAGLGKRWYGPGI